MIIKSLKTYIYHIDSYNTSKEKLDSNGSRNIKKEELSIIFNLLYHLFQYFYTDSVDSLSY